MNNKFNLIVFNFLLVLFSSCIKEDLTPEITSIMDVKYVSEFDNTIYPSFILGLAELEKQENEPFDYFKVSIDPTVETDIRIVIEESKLNYETIYTESKIKGPKTIIPSVKWKYDDLKKISQPGNVDLTFVCYGNNNKELGRKNMKFSYRAINECVFRALVDNEILNLYWLFAGYVNEDSPVVDQFLKDVLTSQKLSSFIGYQGNEDAVDEQVEAIFLTLRKKGVKYSSITNTSNSTQKIASQYVRFSDEVLNNTQANCVDGTVFLCSVLEKIGIHSSMVFVPGHVYLKYYLDDAKTSIRVLETTVVGNNEWSFIDALNYQVVNYNNNIEKLYDKDDSEYVTVDIENARKFIKPIGR